MFLHQEIFAKRSLWGEEYRLWRKHEESGVITLLFFLTIYFNFRHYLMTPCCERWHDSSLALPLNVPLPVSQFLSFNCWCGCCCDAAWVRNLHPWSITVLGRVIYCEFYVLSSHYSSSIRIPWVLHPCIFYFYSLLISWILWFSNFFFKISWKLYLLWVHLFLRTIVGGLYILWYSWAVFSFH